MRFRNLALLAADWADTDMPEGEGVEQGFVDGKNNNRDSL